ncbi:gfo/Idh/MocA family oxidoreductase [Actinomarinicola tropica]|uniref:Gfo/Idh/MocA family oxidoreductase n=2 Tax=Actinomarinicola tropica TaxID=2789776 RepID=A0A5Q2RR89_9ACTN|nr:gfo/Idh/MocA family oxidoreductase [Actinomarinicola tropica]
MARALRHVEGAELVAVGSRSMERAASFAERFGATRAHGSYEALLDDDEVDLVYVATPHSSHRELAVAALEAGRHVLCEKAFAVNAREAREMAAAARASGRFLMEAMWTWFLPPVVELRRRLASGEIGRVRAVEANFSIAVPGPTGRHHELALAGGALLDLGVYPVALSRFLLGPPVEVRALGELGPTAVDVNLGVVASHPDGAVSIFHTGLEARSSHWCEVVGTEGVVRIEPPFWGTSGFTIDRHDGAPERVEVPHHGLAHEAIHAVERIRGGHLESDVIPLDTSVAIMATLDEIRRQIGVTYPADTP